MVQLVKLVHLVCEFNIDIKILASLYLTLYIFIVAFQSFHGILLSLSFF